MRKIILIVLVILQSNLFSQTKEPNKQIKNVRVQKKKEIKFTDLGFGLGLTRSVIFLSRNIKEFNDAPGFNVFMNYGGHKLVRVAAEYSQYTAINIEPTWYDITARTYEANIHFLARFKNNTALIYPITGISVNEFRGFFTGMDDFQNLRDRYPINSRVRSFWVGANFGLGYEHKIGPLKLILAYKMRVGASDTNERLNIMDVCYNLGLRFDIKALTPKYLVRTIFRTYKGRYQINN